MKKILTLILVLTCAFALFACGEDAAPVYTEEAADFITAFGATTVSSLKVTVTADTAEGTLTSTYTTVYNADKTGTMTYSIETIPGLDSTEDLEVLTGTITCDASGKWSDEAISGKLGATGVTFAIDSSAIKTYTIDGNALAITVPAADTQAVIGYAVGSDALISVIKADGKIASITLTYTGVSIVCEYN
jgi:hypothetical protein